jgi:hypothetical protein
MSSGSDVTPTPSIGQPIAGSLSILLTDFIAQFAETDFRQGKELSLIRPIL